MSQPINEAWRGLFQGGNHGQHGGAVAVTVITPASAAAGFAVKEFSRRRGDFAIAAIAAIVMQAANGRLSVRLSTGGISAVPERLRSAEEILEREGLTDATITRAADAAAQVVEPLSDQSGSADYRRELTRTLTQRALSEAAQRIGRSY